MNMAQEETILFMHLFETKCHCELLFKLFISTVCICSYGMTLT